MIRDCVFLAGSSGFGPSSRCRDLLPAGGERVRVRGNRCRRTRQRLVEVHDAYLDDAEHQKTGAKIVAAAQGGVQGVFVYDLEIPD